MATEEQVSGLREDVRLRQSNTTGTRVDPAECKSALTAVDWSPLLAPGSAASRVDVGSPSFRGTGTVEVAALEDIGVVDQHVQNVDRLVQDCGELSFTVDGTFTGGAVPPRSSWPARPWRRRARRTRPCCGPGPR